MFKENALLTYQLKELSGAIDNYFKKIDELTTKEEIEIITYIGELSYKINSGLTRATLNQMKKECE